MAVTYEYQREDGTTFEHRQSMNDERLTVCPTTGQKVKRIFSESNFILNTESVAYSRAQKHAKKKQYDPLYTTDSTYKKKLDERLENDTALAASYDKAKHKLKKQIT